MNNKKKVVYNMSLSLASEALTILLGILVPRFILTSYGSETNGLLSTVTQIYSYIALLEAGVGTATVQALYRTIGIGDRNKTNAVLSATNRYYHRTGILYLIAILLFSIIYPLVIVTDIPIITVVLVIVFNGLGSVISFFFQEKYFLLLQAEGKNYVKTSLTMFTNVFKNIAKIVLMALGFNVVFVQMIAMVVSLIQMLYITWYIKKHYNWIDLKAKPDFDSLSQNKNVLVHQVSGLIFNSTDSILLSFFCGLKVVSVYSLYNLFFNMVITLQTAVSGSVVFVLGQTYHSDKKRFMKLYNCYELYYVTLVFALYSIVNFFILPFIGLYTSDVTDINYINKYLPYLFSAISLLSCGRNAPNNVINFEGHFKQTQWRTILEAGINIVVSVVAIHYLGIYGALIGTIAALLYRTNDIIIYANQKILKRSCWHTYKIWVVNFALFVVLNFVSRFITVSLNSYFSIILFAIPYSLVTLIIFFAVLSLCNIESAKFAINLLKEKFLHKQHA